MLSARPSIINCRPFIKLAPRNMSRKEMIDHGGGHVSHFLELWNSLPDYKGHPGLETTTCLCLMIITHFLSHLRVICHHIVPLLCVLMICVPYIDTCYVYPPDVADPCRDQECSFGAYCVPSLDGMTARCQCPTSCNRYGDSIDSIPVCGSDGINYANQCEMRRSSCNNMKDVHVKYLGKCGEYNE